MMYTYYTQTDPHTLLAIHVKLYKSLVTSSRAVKHGLCLLTLTKWIQAFETKRMRKLLRICYLEHKTND